MGDSLKKKAVSGTIWSAIDRLSVQGVNFILGLVIARLLDPSDYGIIAMITLFITLSNVLVDSGFANALIRKNNRTETDNSTVFYFNVVIGIVVYVVIWFVSPYIARFYNMPLLDSVMKVTALTVPLYSFSIVQQAILTIYIDFKSQAKVSVISALVSGLIGVFLAYNGVGVWSLSVQMVSAAFFRMVLLWLFIKWIPTKPFSKASFTELFSFGSKLLLANMVVAIGRNITTLILGKKLAPSQLGFYNRAEQIGYFPATNLTAVLQRVTFPVFSKMQDNRENLRNNYLKVTEMTSILTFFALGLLFAVAEPMIVSFLTGKWLPSVELLQILITGIVWWPFFALNINVLQVVGLSKHVLIIECIKATVNLVAILMTVQMGVKAVCIALSTAAFLESFIYTYFTRKAIGVSWLCQFKVILPYVAASVVACAVGYVVIGLVDYQWIKILLGGLVYTIIYGLIIYLSRRSEIKFLYATLKEMRQR